MIVAARCWARCAAWLMSGSAFVGAWGCHHDPPASQPLDAAVMISSDLASPDLSKDEEPDMARACLPPRSGREASTLAAQFVRDFLDAVCTREVGCGQIAAAEHTRCVAGALAYVPLGYSIPDAVAAGRLGFSPEAAGDCLADWRRDDCDPSENRFDTFDAYDGYPEHTTPYGFAWYPVSSITGRCPCVLRPLSLDGASCRSFHECIGGDCQGAICSHEGQCRSLPPRAGTGEWCVGATRCFDTDYCDDTRRCRPREDVGGPCRYGSRVDCRPGLYCGGVRGDGSHYCVRPGRGGEPCNGECARGYYCRRDEHTCRRRFARGMACDQRDSCAGNSICDGEICQPWSDRAGACGGCPRDSKCSDDWPEGVCVIASRVEGGPCDPVDDELAPRGCNEFLYCDQRSMTCRPQLLPGEDCSMSRVAVDQEPCYAGACDARSHCCVSVCN